MILPNKAYDILWIFSQYVDHERGVLLSPMIDIKVINILRTYGF